MLGDLMGKLQEAQQKIEAAKAELENKIITEEVQGVKITTTATKSVKNIEIADNLLQDKEMLEDLLLTALNKAFDKADQFASEHVNRATDGMLPGMDELF